MGLRFSMCKNANYKKIEGSSLAELQRSIETVISTISSGTVGSPKSLEDAIDGLRAVNDTLVELSENSGNDSELRRAVTDYLSTTDEVLKFALEILEECIGEAHQAKAILKESMHYFRLKDYEKTANELQNFKSLEDPFRPIAELIAKLRLAYETQELTLEKLLQKYRHRIEKMEMWRTLWIVVFAVVLVVALVCTVMLPALSVPSATVTSVGATTGALGGLRPILAKLWPSKVGEWSDAEEAIRLMQDRSFDAKTELADIKSLVDDLQGHMRSVKYICEEVPPKEEGVQMLEESMKTIRNNMVKFSLSLKALQEKVDGCRRQIQERRKKISRIASHNNKLPWYKRVIQSCNCYRPQQE